MNKRVFWVLGALVIGTAFISLYIWATQSLWNWLVPQIFDGPMISFGQTAGLMLLVCMFSWIAIGGRHHHHHDKVRWKQRWKNKWKHRWDKDWCRMSAEERAEWRKNFRETTENDAHGHWQDRMEKYWAHMSEEERAAFKKRFGGVSGNEN